MTKGRGEESEGTGKSERGWITLGTEEARVQKRMNKARYTATEVACRRAGAMIKKAYLAIWQEQ